MIMADEREVILELQPDENYSFNLMNYFSIVDNTLEVTKVPNNQEINNQYYNDQDEIQIKFQYPIQFIEEKYSQQLIDAQNEMKSWRISSTEELFGSVQLSKFQQSNDGYLVYKEVTKKIELDLTQFDNNPVSKLDNIHGYDGILMISLSNKNQKLIKIITYRIVKDFTDIEIGQSDFQNEQFLYFQTFYFQNQIVYIILNNDIQIGLYSFCFEYITLTLLDSFDSPSSSKISYYYYHPLYFTLRFESTSLVYFFSVNQITSPKLLIQKLNLESYYGISQISMLNGKNLLVYYVTKSDIYNVAYLQFLNQQNSFVSLKQFSSFSDDVPIQAISYFTLINDRFVFLRTFGDTQYLVSLDQQRIISSIKNNISISFLFLDKLYSYNQYTFKMYRVETQIASLTIKQSTQPLQAQSFMITQQIGNSLQKEILKITIKPYSYSSNSLQIISDKQFAFLSFDQNQFNFNLEEFYIGSQVSVEVVKLSTSSRNIQVTAEQHILTQFYDIHFFSEITDVKKILNIYQSNQNYLIIEFSSTNKKENLVGLFQAQSFDKEQYLIQQLSYILFRVSGQIDKVDKNGFFSLREDDQSSQNFQQIYVIEKLNEQTGVFKRLRIDCDSRINKYSFESDIENEIVVVMCGQQVRCYKYFIEESDQDIQYIRYTLNSNELLGDIQSIEIMNNILYIVYPSHLQLYDYIQNISIKVILLPNIMMDIQIVTATIYYFFSQDIVIAAIDNANRLYLFQYAFHTHPSIKISEMTYLRQFEGNSYKLSSDNVFSNIQVFKGSHEQYILIDMYDESIKERLRIFYRIQAAQASNQLYTTMIIDQNCKYLQLQDFILQFAYHHLRLARYYIHNTLVINYSSYNYLTTIEYEVNFVIRLVKGSFQQDVNLQAKVRYNMNSTYSIINQNSDNYIKLQNNFNQMCQGYNFYYPFNDSGVVFGNNLGWESGNGYTTVKKILQIQTSMYQYVNLINKVVISINNNQIRLNNQITLLTQSQLWLVIEDQALITQHQDGVNMIYTTTVYNYSKNYRLSKIVILLSLDTSDALIDARIVSEAIYSIQYYSNYSLIRLAVTDVNYGLIFVFQEQYSQYLNVFTVTFYEQDKQAILKIIDEFDQLYLVSVLYCQQISRLLLFTSYGTLFYFSNGNVMSGISLTEYLIEKKQNIVPSMSLFRAQLLQLNIILLVYSNQNYFYQINIDLDRDANLILQDKLVIYASQDNLLFIGLAAQKPSQSQTIIFVKSIQNDNIHILEYLNDNVIDKNDQVIPINALGHIPFTIQSIKNDVIFFDNKSQQYLFSLWNNELSHYDYQLDINESYQIGMYNYPNQIFQLKMQDSTQQSQQIQINMCSVKTSSASIISYLNLIITLFTIFILL